jgi:hypothetical protein
VDRVQIVLFDGPFVLLNSDSRVENHKNPSRVPETGRTSGQGRKRDARHDGFSRRVPRQDPSPLPTDVDAPQKRESGKARPGGVESRGALPLLSDRVRRSSATEEEVAPTTTDSRQEQTVDVRDAEEYTASALQGQTMATQETDTERKIGSCLLAWQWKIHVEEDDEQDKD